MKSILIFWVFLAPFALGEIISKSLFPKDTSLVTDLNVTQFESIEKSTENIWVIYFYITDDCNKFHEFISSYESVAQAVDGIIKVGAFNGDNYKMFSKQHGVINFPAIKIFGIDKFAVDYIGNWTAECLTEALGTAIEKQIDYRNNVKYRIQNSGIELNNETLVEVLRTDEPWLVQFYSSSCGFSKAFASTWKKVSQALNQTIKLGAFDTLINPKNISEFQIETFPTLKFFKRGLKSPKSVLTYYGNNSVESIVEWALNIYHETLPDPVIYHLINRLTALKACLHSEHCLFILLPDLTICPKSCRLKFLNMLQNIAIKYKRENWCWLWAEAYLQTKIEAILNLKDVRMPLLIFVKLRKKRYQIYTYPFDEENIIKAIETTLIKDDDRVTKHFSILPKIQDVDLWHENDLEEDEQEEPDEPNIRDEL